MKKKEFFDELKDRLEIEDVEINEKTNLQELDEYDSLAVISIIALVDEKFGKRLSGEQFRDVTTIESLMKLIGLENFE